MRVKRRICSYAARRAREILKFIERCCDEKVSVEHSSVQVMHWCQVLLGACRARNRALKERTKRAERGEQGILTDDSIVAVLLAAASTEAFINEFAELIGVYRQNAANWAPDAVTPGMAKAADAIFDLEYARDSTVEKYVVAATALGNPFDKGKAQFQSFDQLLSLRSAIMHIKPPRPDVRHSGEKVTDILARRKIAISRDTWPGSWFDRLQTPEVASWACSAAQSMIFEMLELVPHEETAPFGFWYSHYHRQRGFNSMDWGTDW
jgi:hypothetical protein